MKYKPVCLIDGRQLIVPIGPNGVPSPDSWQCPGCGKVFTQEEVDEQYQTVRAELAKKWAAPTVKTEQQGLWSKKVLDG